MLECHNVPRLPRKTKLSDIWIHLGPPEVTPFAELAVGTAIATSCGRLRTAADGCEHTLNPQTPRVKREPLLRIRENIAYFSNVD